MNKSYPFLFILFILLGNTSYASDNNNRLGADYAFLFLMAMTPSFAASDYTITNDDSPDIDVAIGRFPLTFDLMHNDKSLLEMEVAFGYQFTTATYPTSPDPGEYVDSEWDTYGLGLGLLYSYKITPKMLLRPNLRYSAGILENEARYHGSQTKQFADLFNESHLFNWKANAGVLNAGLGWTYFYEMLQHTSNLRVDINSVYVSSFSEDKEDVKFHEQANMAAVRTNLVFPAGMTIWEEDINLVLLLGTNYFFGENRNTLGYTISYQAGMAIPIPIKFDQKKIFDLHLGYQFLWAENMDAGMFLFGFSLE